MEGDYPEPCELCAGLMDSASRVEGKRGVWALPTDLLLNSQGLLLFP